MALWLPKPLKLREDELELKQSALAHALNTLSHDSTQTTFPESNPGG